MKKYDVTVIGAGAGLMVVEAALKEGLKCCVIEEAKFGGTCLTKGCIPSKILVAPADLIRETQRSKKIGLQFEMPLIQWDVIAERMWGQINLSKRVEAKFRKADDADVIKGRGEFVDSHKMKVTDADGQEVTIESDVFVVATGARTFIPPIPGFEDVNYVTAESFFGDRFPARPWKSVLVMGGGAIGAEFAHIFSSLGAEVDLIEMKPRILSTEEESISEFTKNVFVQNGIRVHTDSQVISAENSVNGKMIVIKNTVTGKEKKLYGEEIFVAAGLLSNGDKINLSNANIDTDKRGYIITDKNMKTSQNHIWALGDINGKYQFRHKANYEADLVIHNLIKKETPMKEADYDTVPWAIFTYPQIAHVGVTEEVVKERGKPYYVGIHHYSQVAGGIALGYDRGDPDDGFIKILVNDKKQIQGVHIVGPHASILVQPFVYLMNNKETCNWNNLKEKEEHDSGFEELRIMCPELGKYTPIHHSMVIHPSLNELTAWVLNRLELKNYEKDSL
jgi:dihydrolipoamide dehydrogenase